MTYTINKTYTQSRNKKEFKAPSDVVKKIYESGAFISNGNINQMTVRSYNKVTGKTEYLGTLKSFIKENTKFKDGNQRNVTRSNLVKIVK